MVAKKAASHNIVGILDIFGFEIFDHNSFEQLCINFCNEKLQQHFNTHVFKEEEKCYISEQIDYSEVEFVDNQDVLDLVEKKPTGLLTLLDNEVKMGARGTDKNFIAQANKSHAKNPRFGRAKRKQGAMYFGVNHYAGRVDYDSEGFLEKNKDELLLNLVELCCSASEPFLQILFSKERGGAASASGSGAPAASGGKSPARKSSGKKSGGGGSSGGGSRKETQAS